MLNWQASKSCLTIINQMSYKHQKSSNIKIKNEIFIGATIQPIQNSEILATSEDTLLFLHKRSLIIMNLPAQTVKSCSIEDLKVLSATYVSTLQVFFVSTDKFLVTVNKDPQIISKLRIPELFEAKSMIILPMEDGYYGVPNQRKDKLIFFSNQYMFEAEIKIIYQRSLLKNKNLSSINIQFVNKPSICHYQWSADFSFSVKLRLLICWNQNEVYVFQTPQKLNDKTLLIYEYDKIIKKNKIYDSDNKINAIVGSLTNKMLICGFQLGSIKIYKLDDSKKYICQLKGHQKQCSSLLISETNENWLYSCGLDNSVRVWDLRDFNQLYQIRFQTITSKVLMLNERLIFAKADQGRNAVFVKLNVGILKPIISDPKSGKLVHMFSDGDWLICLYSNNFVEAFSFGNNYKNFNSKQFNQKIQFPINYGYLRSTVKLGNQKFAICLQKGFSIVKLNKKEVESQNFELKRLVYNHSLTKNNEKGKLMQIIHQKLLDTLFFTVLEDSKNIPIAVKVTAVTFLLDYSVPKWDIDIKGKSDGPSDYVILGSDRGYIFFVNIKKRTQYYCRLYFHSNAISQIERIKPLNSEKLTFVSVTETNQIAIWYLTQNKTPTIYFRLPFSKHVSLFKSVESFVSVGFKTGQFNIFQLDGGTDQLQFRSGESNRQQGHLKGVIAIDYIRYKDKNIWLTGGQDYAIKLWRDVQKTLILEIRFFDVINCVVFAKKNIDIILSHGKLNQISVLTQTLVAQLQDCRKKLDESFDEQANNLFNSNFKQLIAPKPSQLSPVKKRDLSQQIAEELNTLKRNSKEQMGKMKPEDPFKQKSNEINLSMQNQKKSREKSDNESQSNSKQLQKKSSNQSSGLFFPKIKSKQIPNSLSSFNGDRSRFSRYQQSSRYMEFEKQGQRESGLLQRLKTAKVKAFSYAGKHNI